MATVMPKKDKVEDNAKDMGLDGSYENQLKDKHLRQKVLAEIHKIAKIESESLNGFEMSDSII